MIEGPGKLKINPEALSEVSLIESREKVQNSFNSFFQSKGLERVEPASLVSGDVDPTVIFIGSSTNVFKKYLDDISTLPDRGVALWQDKLRTQNYELSLTDENPEFCSYFTGGGILMSAGSYEELCQVVLDFLREELGVSEQELQIKVSSEDKDLATFWGNRSASADLNISDNLEEFRWTFGEDGLEGRGILLSVKSKDSDQYGEFSTLEIIERNGDELAVEWGFGLETFIAKRNGLHHPIAASKIAGAFPSAVEPQNVKLTDSLIAAMAILNEGVSPNKKIGGKPGTVLRRFLQKISYYVRENGILVDDIEDWCDYLSTNEFTNYPNAKVEVLDFLSRARNREKRLEIALLNATAGDLRDLMTLEGVRGALNKGEGVSVAKLADAYAYIGFEQSSFYSRIQPFIDSAGCLITPSSAAEDER